MGIVGQIALWPAERIPQGFLACDGAEFGSTTAPQLWEVITQTYGSAGRSFGRLPSFGGRRALGAGQGPGLPDYPLGSSGNDSSAGAGGVGFFSMPSIILTEGSLPWQPAGGSLGTILPFAGERVPEGYALCDGRILQIEEHSALFWAISTRFGGDGRLTFGLPDLRGRTPFAPAEGKWVGPGEDRSIVGPYGYQAINYVISVAPSYSEYDPIIGEIIYTTASSAPPGWAFCHGQQIQLDGNGNSVLRDLLGTRFGGEPGTFALPDLRGGIVIDGEQGIGTRGTLTTGGDGQVAYLGIEPIIALQGSPPSFD